jgi:hypothetical protein
MPSNTTSRGGSSQEHSYRPGALSSCGRPELELEGTVRTGLRRLAQLGNCGVRDDESAGRTSQGDNSIEFGNSFPTQCKESKWGAAKIRTKLHEQGVKATRPTKLRDSALMTPLTFITAGVGYTASTPAGGDESKRARVS